MISLYSIDIVSEESRQFCENNFILSNKKIAGGEVYPLHWHNYYELEIILNGTGEHDLNKRRYALRRGNAYLLSYFDLHSFSAFTDMEILSIRFNEKLLPPRITDYVTHGASLECTFDEAELSSILKKAAQIKDESRGFVFYSEITSIVIAEIVLMLIKKNPLHSNPVMPTPVQQVLAYIIKNFRDDISLKAAAAEVSLTPQHLGVIFRSGTGISFHDYLNNLRLKYACGLLSSTDISVKDVAFSSGYNSVEHFAATFKKQFGITPTQYRITEKSHSLRLI